MKKSQLLITIAAVLMLGSTLADSLFHAPDIIIIAVLAVASFILWRGVRLQRRAKEREEDSSPKPMLSPPRRFALLVSAFVFTAVSGFFTLRYSHPEQTATLHAIISTATFICGATVSYRQCFRQQAPPPNHQNQNDQNA